jgi:glucose/arabinose dehydrogenase
LLQDHFVTLLKHIIALATQLEQFLLLMIKRSQRTEGFNPPLTGINYHNGNIYVSHRGFITIIKPDGTKEDIISRLPGFGDHHNNQVVFGCDGKMYFGQGTATNSGVVGLDNEGWNQKFPYFHDYPGAPIVLNGQNFKTKNIHVPLDKMPAYTGAYSPFGIPNMALESVKGIKCASGSILRANPDGSNLELVAWGLRNPFRMKFDRYNRLFCANHGADVRGSRPIDKCPDDAAKTIFKFSKPFSNHGF